MADETTGRKIERTRRGKHPKVSQEQLAHDAGISRNTLVLIERGQTKYPAPDTLEQIAHALDVPILDIVGEEHPIYKVAERIAEEMTAYKTTKQGPEGATLSHSDISEKKGRESRVAHIKRRAG